MGRWQRLLYLNWTGTTRQWKTLRAANLTLGAFYLMGYAFVHMLLTTDLGQSLLPGWRSGIFPVYSAVTGIQAGIATTLLTLALMRRFSPEAGRFIGDEQASALGKILLATVLMWFYFFWVRLPCWSGTPDFPARLRRCKPRWPSPTSCRLSWRPC